MKMILKVCGNIILYRETSKVVRKLVTQFQTKNLIYFIKVQNSNKDMSHKYSKNFEIAETMTKSTETMTLVDTTTGLTGQVLGLEVSVTYLDQRVEDLEVGGGGGENATG